MSAIHDRIAELEADNARLRKAVGILTTMTNKDVRVRLTLRQANALVQLAEEASLETFDSTEETEAKAEAMKEAGLKAIDKLHDAILGAKALNHE